MIPFEIQVVKSERPDSSKNRKSQLRACNSDDLGEIKYNTQIHASHQAYAESGGDSK